MSRLFLVSLLLLSVSCATTPREINGHKVIGTKQINGKTVYVFAPTKEDRDIMEAKAKEAEEASKDVVFPANE